MRNAFRLLGGQMFGLLVLAGITAALSFSHLREVAAAAGQTGWQAWAYPVSVDLLMTFAWMRLRDKNRGSDGRGAAWGWFLLALATSLGANIATAGVLDLAAPPLWLRIVVAGWPAVSLLGGVLLVHAAFDQLATAAVTDPPDTPAAVAAAGIGPAVPVPLPGAPWAGLPADALAALPPAPADPPVAALPGRVDSPADTGAGRPARTPRGKAADGGARTRQGNESKPPRRSDGELLNAARALAAAGKETSASALMREFGIGSARAGRIRDALGGPTLVPPLPADAGAEPDTGDQARADGGPDDGAVAPGDQPDDGRDADARGDADPSEGEVA